MIMFDKKGTERYRKVGFKAGDESVIIAEAEGIMYSERKRQKLAEARARRAEQEQAEAAEAEVEPDEEQAAPAVRKTTGCASTT